MKSTKMKAALKKCMALLLCTMLLLTAVPVEAIDGFWATTEDSFRPVGEVKITWDANVGDKLVLDGDMSDWTSNNYEMTTITPDNLVGWVGEVPSTWQMRCAFVADSERLYVGFYIVDDKACTGDNPAGYNGDAFQMAFDWNCNVANALEEDPDCVGNPEDIFYSFCLTEDGTLQMMRQNSDGIDDLVYDGNEVDWDEEYKDIYGDVWQGIAGATDKTTDGWCAEFSIEWQRLANDCRWKRYDEYDLGIYKPAQMSPDSPLTIGCSLRYLNRDENNGAITWAAGTMNGNTNSENDKPLVTWQTPDDGVKLVLEYEDGMSFAEGSGITIVDSSAETEAATEPSTEPADWLEYTLSDDGKGYIVTNSNRWVDGDIVIPATYNGKPVTGIGNSAFSGCSGLTSVTIGNNVTDIDSYAFAGCSGLTSIVIPDSVIDIGYKAFGECYELMSATIGNGVTNIDSYAFVECSSLTSVMLGNSVTNIGYKAFGNCSSLTSVVVPDSVTDIGKRAFESCSGLTSVTLGNSVSSIEEYVFSGCSGLTSVTIGNSVTNIDSCAFKNCSSLTSVTIGNSVTTIGRDAFYNCFNLESVIIPNSVTSIGMDAFYHCSNLASVVIPNSVTSIGGGAFSGCESLTSVTIGNRVTSIEKYVFHQCSSLKSIVIPDSVTSIEKFAFYQCDSLTSVTIGNGVVSLGESAFYGCSSLASVVIPDKVVSIVDRAFALCENLTSVTIGNSVTNIGECAFAGCESLTSITFNGPEAWWDMICKGDDWDDRTGSYIMYFTDRTEPATEPDDEPDVIDIFDGGNMSADTYYENGDQLQDGNAADWLAANRDLFENGISGVDSIGLRGWAYLAGKTAKIYGYMLINSDLEYEFIWNGSFLQDGSDVNSVLGRTDVTRYNIIIDLTKLAAGEYIVIPLFQTEDGTIAILSQWGVEGMIPVVVFGTSSDVGTETDPATDTATEPATDPTTDPTTEPATEPATEPSTEPSTSPWVSIEDPDAGKLDASFDDFEFGSTGYHNGGEAGNCFTQLGDVGYTVNATVGDHESMLLRGWAEFDRKTIKAGYSINGSEIVWVDSFMEERADVVAAGHPNAFGFNAEIPTAELTVGTHRVAFVLRLEDGTEISFAEITLNIEKDLETEISTNPATEPVTEPATEPVTEPVTDPVTDPATEPVTEPVTEFVTEPTTSNEAESKTEFSTEAPTATSATATDAEDDGCSSVIGVGAAALVLSAMAAAVALKKH